MALRPNQALILALAVPGLGHFLQRSPLRGLVAAVAVLGPLLAGYAILGQRLWFGEAIAGLPIPLLLPELLAPLPTVALSLLRETDPSIATRIVQLPVPGESLGFLLTGAAGLFSAFQMADAVWLAQRGSAGEAPLAPSSPSGSSPNGSFPTPAIAAALTWLLPGLGHALLGQRGKGILVGAAVWIVFLAGLFAGAGHSCDRGLFPVWWTGMSPFGGGITLAALTTAPGTMREFPLYLDLGVVLCTVAGLMNVILMTDAYTIAERGGVRAAGAAGSPAAQATSAGETA